MADGVTPEYLGRFVPLMQANIFRRSRRDQPDAMVVPDPDPWSRRTNTSACATPKNCRYVSVKARATAWSAKFGSVRRGSEALLDDMRAGPACDRR
jgi:hypothetical protein